ncbi:MAG: hypothetical protein A2Y25_04725 [Candidatus Melainabacteria bacterium GWF2_37_15]|nr:MAG: hypothetical protein A2Y25_04725 [Candidatus Melainabacteria bacterium GWF2_37_15]
MKILIIEDDYSANSIFNIYLGKYGDCDSVTTGFDGMKKFRETLDKGLTYDLIVIDIILPDMNGYTVLDSIRAEEDARKFTDEMRAKIVLTTSLDDDENRKLREKLRYGYENYYVKSPVLDGLQDKLLELGIKLN